MKLNKSILGVVSTMFLTAALVGCGMTVENQIEEGKNGSEVAEKPGSIVEGLLKTTLEKVEGTVYKYTFTIQNDKTEDQTLVFPSSQEYDYRIMNEAGETLYTFSMDKSFMQVITEKVLKPGESLEFEVDLTEGLQKVESGKYTVEIWATVKDSDGLKAEVEVDFDKSTLEDETTLDGEVFTTEPVTYVGLIDLNSIEIINEEGTPEVYRLSETAKEQVTELAKDDTIIIEFTVDSDGQRVAESFTIQSN
ncbi:hypothetical protein IM538_22200 [Cytobacillus suaedae]|nr:hypothetical protein IM538_22200 [Cytobacillus suaedae]